MTTEIERLRAELSDARMMNEILTATVRMMTDDMNRGIQRIEELKSEVARLKVDKWRGSMK